MQEVRQHDVEASEDGGRRPVGGAIWYARAATVPLIVAALISSTQLLPRVDCASRHGVKRGLVITASLLGSWSSRSGWRGSSWTRRSANLGGLGADISEGADQVVAWLQAHNDWVKQHEEQINDFLKGLPPAAKSAANGLASGLLGGLSLVAPVVSGLLLMLVFLLYLVSGREQPDRERAGTRAAGRRTSATSPAARTARTGPCWTSSCGAPATGRGSATCSISR
jgi:predicted PurR-regulated permease PerM